MYGHQTSYFYHVVWNILIHPLISVSLSTWWLALVFKRTHTALWCHSSKDVRSSSWLRSRYFYPSSQIHTRVCELCLWASTADRGQQPPADWSPQQNIRGCLYLTVDNLAGSDITRTRRLEEKGSNQTSMLLIINHTKLHHRQDGCQIVSPGQYKTSRRKLFKAEWPSSSSPSFLSSRPTLLRTSSTLCSSRWVYLHPRYMQMQHSTAGLHEERRLQLQLRVKF